MDEGHLPPKDPETTNFAWTKSKNEYRETKATIMIVIAEKTSPPLANLFGLWESAAESLNRERLTLFRGITHQSPQTISEAGERAASR